MVSSLQPGDEVIVFDRNGRRLTEYPGEVIKPGRTLVTIAYGDTRPYTWSAKFHMDTGAITGNYGGVWFQTLEQAAADKRAAEAKQVLNDAGLQIKLGSHPPSALLEALAAAAKAFRQGAEGG